MLVDLGRNDIGRVCKYGTVHPESLMEIKDSVTFNILSVMWLVI
ncbi:hypothetical protein BD31_I2196 [Candidatus Nitrosopumilus salaria BD31]|uniref:Uncharacterized protein n=1 Tax=Candidatus Nitrosopumilus salarius BD31 TaxID=859350 RepID=I3D4B2_9ARCH|nr:hypothetical protein BD31_I2196 [Candidatus Nitrosopumilus salaria BD31]